MFYIVLKSSTKHARLHTTLKLFALHLGTPLPSILYSRFKNLIIPTSRRRTQDVYHPIKCFFMSIDALMTSRLLVNKQEHVCDIRHVTAAAVVRHRGLVLMTSCFRAQIIYSSSSLDSLSACSSQLSHWLTCSDKQ